VPVSVNLKCFHIFQLMLGQINNEYSMLDQVLYEIVMVLLIVQVIIGLIIHILLGLIN